MANTRSLTLIAGGLLGVAFVMFVVSTGLPLWGTGEADDISVTAGLWRGCIEFNTNPEDNLCSASALTCSGIRQELLGQCLKLMMARTFIILACILSAFGTILLLTIGFRKKSNPTLIILGKGVVIASLICGIIGFAVGISWVLLGSGKLLAAAILTIVATALNLFSAIICLMIRKEQT